MKSKKRFLPSFIILLQIILTSLSCKDDPVTPPPPPVIPKDTINISIADYTHRSITVNINSTANNPESFIRLYRLFNNSETLLSEYPITVKDTTIIDDDNGTGLLLNTEYSYYAVRTDTIGERKDTSNLVQAITLDTTSHNYTWQEWVIGDWQSSLTDVWGTDENNVYAVGGLEIDGNHYSVLHYDGNTWTPITDTVGGHSVFGFSSDDIWIIGGGVYHLENNSWVRKDAKMINFTFHILDTVLFNNSPYTSLWGTSSSNMYFGNNKGTIIHWNGTKGNIVHTQKDGIYISDIQGYNQNYILACGSTLAPPAFLEKYEYGSWNEVTGINTNTLLYSIFINNPEEYYVAGERIWINKKCNWSVPFTDNPVLRQIRGNKSTGEIAAVGYLSTLYLYNGSSWKKFQFTISQYSPINSVFLTNNKIFAVGTLDDQARIIIGTKN